MRRIYTMVLFVVIASIDNTVLAVLPAIAPRARQDFGIGDRSVGLLISSNLLIVALTALFWGYRSDQSDRRRLLIMGTMAWVVPIGLVPYTTSFPAFFALMLAAGIGLGCISTVGYSIITDLVPARWRGLMLGLWGLAQGVGALMASLIVGTMAEEHGWRAPFGMIAVVGVVCSLLGLLALAPRKGESEEALRTLGETGIAYEYRIRRADLPVVFRKPSMRWLMLQGFVAQFAYGSLVWITVLLTARLTHQGLRIELANGVAALLWFILQLGGVVSLFWGWVGDRLQHTYPRARATLAAYGFWAALPCYLVLFWAPLPLHGTPAPSAATIVRDQLGHNGWWWVVIVGATLAVIAQGTNAPNWYALVSEVNLPEHRGTAFSFITLANNIGRACGVFLVGVTFDWLQQTIATPTNYALGLTLFQLFFLPAGLCFWFAARTTPQDAREVQETLHRRAAAELKERNRLSGALTTTGTVSS